MFIMSMNMRCQHTLAGIDDLIFILTSMLLFQEPWKITIRVISEYGYTDRITFDKKCLHTVMRNVLIPPIFYVGSVDMAVYMVCLLSL